MPNISPRDPGVHESLSDAELVALGLVPVEIELDEAQRRALRRQAAAHYGRDHGDALRVSRFDLRGTRRTLLVVHPMPRPSAAVILDSLARVLAEEPAGGTA